MERIKEKKEWSRAAKLSMENCVREIRDIYEFPLSFTERI